jgi:single-strand DNA-binding protein
MINKVILMGRLTADPELKTTSSGISACRFNVAVDRKFADKATGERQADFISVQTWRQSAEFVSKYFHKGSMIIVEGTLQNNNYTDQNGTKHYGYIVNAENVSFGESRAAASWSGGQQATQQTSQQATATNNASSVNVNDSYATDDIPF